MIFWRKHFVWFNQSLMQLSELTPEKQLPVAEDLTPSHSFPNLNQERHCGSWIGCVRTSLPIPGCWEFQDDTQIQKGIRQIKKGR